MQPQYAQPQYTQPQYVQPQYSQPACETSYPVAQSGHVTQPHAAQTYGVQPYTGQTVAASAYAAAPALTYGAQLQGTQPYLETAQNFPAYQNAGYAPAYVSPQPRPAAGLRQAYTYGTLGATLYDVDSDIYGIQGRLGWQSKTIFGVEAEGSFGLNDDEATVDFGTGPVLAESGVDTQFAVFGVARFPVSNRFNVLGRVGYHETEFEAEFDDGTTVLEQDFSTDGLAYGLGVEYALNPQTSVRADYTRYDFDGPEADALSLAIARKF